MSTEPGHSAGVTTTETGPPVTEKGLKSTAPSTLDEKTNGELECSSNGLQAGAAQASDDGKQAVDAAGVEYPSGFKLVSIILVLVMGIFLASLDMVSGSKAGNWHRVFLTLNIAPDHCCHRHP